MKRQRRRRPRARDEVVAPWVAAAVILGGWGLAAQFIAPQRQPDRAAGPRPATVTAAPQPQTTAPGITSREPEREQEASSLERDGSAPTIGTRGASGEPPPSGPATDDPDTSRDLAALRDRNLLVPVAGLGRAVLVPSFSDARGSRAHEALDVLAPRGTPVVAADDGTIVKLFKSVRGGTTIYQFDPTGSFCYYYAHLDAYEPGLGEGDAVERGEIIGYVGTTGNAPPGTPHLHFAIFRLGPERQWWEGVPIDPYLVLR